MLMQKLREKTKLILWIVTIAFLGWILLDLGMDIVGKRLAQPYEQGFIAEIDGVRVPYDFYRDILYQMLQDSSRKKGELTDFEEKGIEKEAWYRVIEEIKFRKIAQERNLILDDSTVFFLLMNYPPPQIYNDTFFKRGDTFDIQKYREFMLDPRNYSFAVQYENLIRQTFPKELMRFDLMTLIHFTQEEIVNNFKKNLTTYGIEYLIFDPVYYNLEEKVKEEELIEYYNSHPEEFRETPLVNLKMAIFWKRPSREDTLSKIEEAKTVREVILGGTPFEEAVRSYSSSDTLRKTGGEIGWFSISNFPENIQNVVDTLKGVSQPLIWRGRVYIFKIEKREKDRVLLKGIDFVIKTGDATKASIREKATEFVNLIKKVGFEKAADSLKLQIKETGLFPMTLNFIPFIGENQEVLDFIQRAKVGDVSELIWRPEYLVICKIVEKKEGETKKFSDVRDRIERKLLLEKKRKKLMEEAREIFKRWKEDINFKPPAKNYVFFQKVENFKPGDRLSGISNSVKIIGILEGLKEGDVSIPFELDNKIILIKLLSKKLPSDEEVNEKLKIYVQNLTMYRFNQIWNAWKEELRSAERLKDYRSYLLY